MRSMISLCQKQQRRKKFSFISMLNHLLDGGLDDMAKAQAADMSLAKA